MSSYLFTKNKNKKYNKWQKKYKNVRNKCILPSSKNSISLKNSSVDILTYPEQGEIAQE